MSFVDLELWQGADRGLAMDSPMRKSNRTEEDCSDFSRGNKIQWCTRMESIASISASADLLRELSIEHRGDVCWIEWYRSLILQAWISLCCRLSAVTSAVIQTLSRSLMRSMACCCCRCYCAATVPKSSLLLPSKKKSFGEFTRSDELQLLPAGHQAREFRHLHVANIWHWSSFTALIFSSSVAIAVYAFLTKGLCCTTSPSSEGEEILLRLRSYCQFRHQFFLERRK